MTLRLDFDLDYSKIKYELGLIHQDNMGSWKCNPKDKMWYFKKKKKSYLTFELDFDLDWSKITYDMALIYWKDIES